MARKKGDQPSSGRPCACHPQARGESTHSGSGHHFGPDMTCTNRQPAPGGFYSLCGVSWYAFQDEQTPCRAKRALDYGAKEAENGG